MARQEGGSRIRITSTTDNTARSFFWKAVEKMRSGIAVSILLVFTTWMAWVPVRVSADTGLTSFIETVRIMASFQDRSAGSEGCDKAAEYVYERFSAIPGGSVGELRFSIPVRRHGNIRLRVVEENRDLPLNPISCNAVSPGTVPPQGITGPLIYAGKGNLSDFNGKTVEGAIVAMDVDSGANWLNAANLGALALIYIDRGDTRRAAYQALQELTPMRFPRFHMSGSDFSEGFGTFENRSGGLFSDAAWVAANARNMYCLVPGNDPDMKDQLVIVEAFYDSTAFVPGQSPGADEASGIATLLAYADALKNNPPPRSVLLVATAGHAQTLAGMRELIWTLNTKKKQLKNMKEDFETEISDAEKQLAVLDGATVGDYSSPDIPGALEERIKTETDRLSKELMVLRMNRTDETAKARIQETAKRRLALRRFGWRTDLSGLSEGEKQWLEYLVPLAVRDWKTILTDAKKQRRQLKSAIELKKRIGDAEIAAVISLHLSGRGSGFGAFHSGWLHELNARIDRTAIYSGLDDVIGREAARIADTFGLPPLCQDTLRPSRLRSWQSRLPDHPVLGGEVSAIAGYLGFTLATVDDARGRWGTPEDLPEHMDTEFSVRQCQFVCALIDGLVGAPGLRPNSLPRNGFATIEGKTRFIRQGELFPDQPAPGAVIMAYQGGNRYYAMTDALGRFVLKGMADKKHVPYKAVIEAFRFDPDNGGVQWAIDKEQTGKSAYRLKMSRRNMETTLVLFSCRDSTLFGLLEPRNFRHMTKIQLLDASREAPPLRYAYSRIDTRATVAETIFMEPGSRFKVTLSDSLLKKKIILTNASEGKPEGAGYPIDDTPFLYHTEYRIASDMWQLLGPRIEDLESRGIVNERVRELAKQGEAKLAEAANALATMQYDKHAQAAAWSWAIAETVYNHVETDRKDVLFGVLFYIALFVPFSFCLERLVFCHSNIYRRILAFLGILTVTVTLIYVSHPAFRMAYSPIVIILAFFLLALSVMVALIVYFRFEAEMTLLKRRAHEMNIGEISRSKAFTASFFIGVSNLRRRRLRTALTCLTLIVLTFTIMSFTSVKSAQRHSRIFFSDNPPYRGFLMKNLDWRDFPEQAMDTVNAVFAGKGEVFPRVWLEETNRDRPIFLPIRFGDKTFDARGAVGMSASETPEGMLTAGTWFKTNEARAVLLSDRMAQALGIGNPDNDRAEGFPTEVFIRGEAFTVAGVFDSKKLARYADLDGEPVTPAVFPAEVSRELTDVEIDAMESGEDVTGFQSRYHHVQSDLVVIMPFRTLLAAGGKFKSFSLRPKPDADPGETARILAGRFDISIFSGEPDGTFLYQASETLNYSGVPNIVIPIAISVCIVLNTMIGSVFERKREIAVYTSVGLAPSHVSFLFIAEALALAVLSAVPGYLLAQVAASFLSGTRLWAGLTVNYSSLSGIAAMGLVMLVVLASVIYPSRMAARIAVPDVYDSWDFSCVADDFVEIQLPFLIRHSEIRSLGGYIFDYIQEHTDVAQGPFSTKNVRFDERSGEEAFREKFPAVCDIVDTCRMSHADLSAVVWLAPFDFGLMQRVTFLFLPSDSEPGFLEIRMVIERMAGEADAWKKTCRRFVNEIRKRFLIWRSFDEQARETCAGYLEKK